MRGTLDAAFELNNLIIIYSMVLKLQKKNNIIIKQSLKREEASNRLREDTAARNSGDRGLSSGRWTVRGTLLQSV